MVDMDPKAKLETSIVGKKFDLRKCGFETENEYNSDSEYSSDEDDDIDDVGDDEEEDKF